jgi:hypothetical protein
LVIGNEDTVSWKDGRYNKLEGKKEGTVRWREGRNSKEGRNVRQVGRKEGRKNDTISSDAPRRPFVTRAWGR